MSRPSVNGVAAIELGVPDLEASVAFYEQTWALTPTVRTPDACYFRAAGRDPYVFALHRASEPGLVRVRLHAQDRATVDALVDRVTKAGGFMLRAPGALSDPGSGYGFAFHDPAGREFVVFCDETLHDAEALPNDRPYRLSHVVLNSIDLDRATDFMRDALGFRLRDRTSKASFMGCNSDHHSLALTNRKNSLVGHIAFDLPNLDAVMRGCGRLKRAGLTIEWGVGRHGTGDNVFAYFVDPNGFVIEYTSEMEQVDDATYQVGTPASIARAAHSDMWGFAAPPTERFLKALWGPGGA